VRDFLAQAVFDLAFELMGRIAEWMLSGFRNDKRR
jgi:hypothetical protein